MQLRNIKCQPFSRDSQFLKHLEKKKEGFFFRSGIHGNLQVCEHLIILSGVHLVNLNVAAIHSTT